MRTAKSKGATNTAILYQHGLKNALIPVITMMGMQFGNILTGAFIVETVFAWPGIGRLGVTSLFERDFPGHPGRDCAQLGSLRALQPAGGYPLLGAGPTHPHGLKYDNLIDTIKFQEFQA